MEKKSKSNNAAAGYGGKSEGEHVRVSVPIYHDGEIERERGKEGKQRDWIHTTVSRRRRTTTAKEMRFLDSYYKYLRSVPHTHCIGYDDDNDD